MEWIKINIGGAWASSVQYNTFGGLGELALHRYVWSQYRAAGLSIDYIIRMELY